MSAKKATQRPVLELTLQFLRSSLREYCSLVHRAVVFGGATCPAGAPVERWNFVVGDLRGPDIGTSAASSAWMENLFDLSPDLMCLASVDGYFKRVNRAFERTLGHLAQELVSRPMIDFVHPDDRERTRTALEVMATGEELHQFENRYICRDGAIRWLQWNCRPVPGTGGLVAAAARDITDSMRRKEQAALRRVATVVAHAAAPSDVFAAVAAEIADLLDADLTLIGRYEPEATFAYLAAGGRMQAISGSRPTMRVSAW